MYWKTVQKFAADNGLGLYTTGKGHCKQMQITTTDGEPVSWTSNKAGSAMIALQAIVHQKALAKIPTDEIIILANDYHSDLYQPTTQTPTSKKQ